MYTSSNTTISCFMNLDNGDQFRPMQAILRPKYSLIIIIKYFGLMMACIGRNQSPLFKVIKRKIVAFHEVYILFHFNIILKHNGMSSTKITHYLSISQQRIQNQPHSNTLVRNRHYILRINNHYHTHYGKLYHVYKLKLPITKTNNQSCRGRNRCSFSVDQKKTVFVMLQQKVRTLTETPQNFYNLPANICTATCHTTKWILSKHCIYGFRQARTKKRLFPCSYPVSPLVSLMKSYCSK